MGNRLTVREMTAADFPAVLAVAAGLGGVRMHPDEDQGWHDRFIRRNAGLCLVAESDAGAVGFVYCGVDGRRATVYHLCVSAGHQGMGIGSALLGELERRVRGAGVRRAQLVVLRSNARAVDFYVRAGWQVRGDVLFLTKDV